MQIKFYCGFKHEKHKNKNFKKIIKKIEKGKILQFKEYHTDKIICRKTIEKVLTTGELFEEIIRELHKLKNALDVASITYNDESIISLSVVTKKVVKNKKIDINIDEKIVLDNIIWHNRYNKFYSTHKLIMNGLDFINKSFGKENPTEIFMNYLNKVIEEKINSTLYEKEIIIIVDHFLDNYGNDLILKNVYKRWVDIVFYIHADPLKIAKREKNRNKYKNLQSPKNVMILNLDVSKGLEKKV